MAPRRIIYVVFRARTRSSFDRYFSFLGPCYDIVFRIPPSMKASIGFGVGRVVGIPVLWVEVPT
jgi:hypothetical protein